MDMTMEELAGRAFQRAARLTPEQMGMLKLYLTIMRELDEAEEKKERLKSLVACNLGESPAMTLRYDQDNKNAAPENKTPAPANEMPVPANENPESDNTDAQPEPDAQETETKPARSRTKEPVKEIAPEVARFAEYLTAHNISQARAAAELGIKAGSISNMVTGKYKASPRTCAAMKEYVDAREAHVNPPRAAANN